MRILIITPCPLLKSRNTKSGKSGPPHTVRCPQPPRVPVPPVFRELVPETNSLTSRRQRLHIKPNPLAAPIKTPTGE